MFIVKKALTFPTWVWQTYRVMLQVKSIQRFKCSGVVILEPHFLEIPVQETNKKENPARKENKVQKTLDSVTVPTSALRAEVLWTLKVISSHYSLRSCLGLKELFEAMFSDSEIAKSFKLSKTKCGYFKNFELAPYFKDSIVKEIKAANIFIVLFDESLNKVLQEEQMDVQFRYWNEAAKQVNTRFFHS